MVLRIVLEGLVLGALLVLLCVVGIRKSPVDMVYLYPPEVRERCVKLGLTTPRESSAAAQFSKQSVFPATSFTRWSAFMQSTAPEGSWRDSGR